jgi:hypothetical protein
MQHTKMLQNKWHLKVQKEEQEKEKERKSEQKGRKQQIWKKGIKKREIMESLVC